MTDDAPDLSTKLYVYAVISDEDFSPETTGIDETELHLVGDLGGPRAIVHSHDGGPYDGPDDDVKRWVIEHSAVIEDGWQRAGSVLPVSFNVIVRPDLDSGASATQQLQRWLEATRTALSTRLHELEGTSELRVELNLERREFVDGSEEVRNIRADMADRPAGVRRLLEKRLDKTEKEFADQAADGLYPDLRARIAAHCQAIAEHRGPERRAGLTPVLMASCLVAETEIQALGAELTAIQNEHSAIAIRFLGPWPPYSFADLSGSVAHLGEEK